MVSLVIKSLLSSSGTRQSESFDFDAFYAIIQESTIVKEIIAALTDGAPTHINPSFEVVKVKEAPVVTTGQSSPPLIKTQVSLQEVMKLSKTE